MKVTYHISGEITIETNDPSQTSNQMKLAGELANLDTWGITDEYLHKDCDTTNCCKPLAQRIKEKQRLEGIE